MKGCELVVVVGVIVFLDHLVELEHDDGLLHEGCRHVRWFSLEKWFYKSEDFSFPFLVFFIFEDDIFGPFFSVLLFFIQFEHEFGPIRHSDSELLFIFEGFLHEGV